MKYPYEINIFRFSGRNWMEFVFPKRAEILSHFLFTDVGSAPSYFLKPINRVLNNESEREAIIGDICELEVGKENTVVYSAVVENCKTNACVIPTVELKQLIEEWITEYHKFKQGH